MLRLKSFSLSILIRSKALALVPVIVLSALSLYAVWTDRRLFESDLHRTADAYANAVVDRVRSFLEPPPEAIPTRLVDRLHEEEVQRDLDKAIVSYEAIQQREEAQRPSLALANYRLAECYRKKGEIEKAIAQYRRVLDHYTDVLAVAEDSGKRLKELGTGGALSSFDIEPAERSSELEDAESAELIRLEELLIHKPDLVLGGNEMKQAIKKGFSKVVR